MKDNLTENELYSIVEKQAEIIDTCVNMLAGVITGKPEYYNDWVKIMAKISECQEIIGVEPTQPDTYADKDENYLLEVKAQEGLS